MYDRTKTYIKGFDEVIGEGLPKDQIILISGSAGTMKSSLSFYILYKNAIENGTASIYVCFEEEENTFVRNMQSLGMDIEKTNGKVVIIGATERSFLDERCEQMNAVGWIESVKGDSVFLQGLKFKIKRFTDVYNAELLVLDSLDSLVLLSKMDEPRDEIFKFFEWLRELKITTIIIGETPATHPILIENEGYSEDFLADGIIQLKMEKINELAFRRFITCVKMRAGEHSPDYFVLSYDNQKMIFEVTKAIY